MLKEIEIKKIKPHKNNPRKDLGNLEELVESIKAKGILQNLTVIENDKGGYTALIGHRRLAAAKLAGLKTVPCVIAVMDEKEQVATMLLENMQRQDLTIVEQADGFQMMLDLGETVKSIAQKTGFTQKTVKHRVEITKLDQEYLGKIENLKIADLIKLEKLKDPENKNEALQTIGSHSFDYTIATLIKKEAWEKQKLLILAKLEDMGQITGEERYSKVWWFKGRVATVKELETVIGNAESKDIKYYPNEYESNVTIYTKADEPSTEVETEVETDEERAARKRQFLKDEAKEALKNLRKTFGELQETHIKELNEKEIDLKAMVAYMVSPYDGTKYPFESTWLPYKEGVEEMIHPKNFTKTPKKAFVAIMYRSLFTRIVTEPYNWRGEYDCDQSDVAKRQNAYGFMALVGYQPSDEEMAFAFGTHELYKVAELNKGENK